MIVGICFYIMKRIVIIVGIWLGCVCNLHAHGPQEGCTAIMGGFGFMRSNMPGVNPKTTITIAPGINYFVRDNYSIGARATLRTEVIRKIKQTTHNEISVFGRYYFTRKVMGIKASLFLEGNAGYGTAKVKPITVVDQTRSFNIGALAGFALFPTEHIGFELSLPNLVGFHYSTYQNEFSGSNFAVGPSGIATPQITMFVFID